MLPIYLVETARIVRLLYCLDLAEWQVTVDFFSDPLVFNGQIKVSRPTQFLWFLFVCFVFVFFLWLHLWRMDVPGLGVNPGCSCSLCHSHSNTRSKSHLRPLPQLTLAPGPYTTEQGQRSNPHHHRHNVRSFTHWATIGTFHSLLYSSFFSFLVCTICILRNSSLPYSPNG